MEKTPTIINLLAGDLVILPKPGTVVSTVLGSCVTVIFYVPGSISMVCHALLPSIVSLNGLCIESCPSPCQNPLNNTSDYRYVTCSLKFMIGELQKRHIHPSQVHTSVIGGSNILQSRELEEGIGYKNVLAAKEILARHGFTINREDTGGFVGRNIKYYSESNTVMLKIHGEKKEFELGDKFEHTTTSMQRGLDKLNEEVQKLNK